MAYTSRGNKFNVEVPNTAEALEAYEDGRRLYFTKKGQLNFSCADCHVYQTGTKLRADIPSPAIGHPTLFQFTDLGWEDWLHYMRGLQDV